MRAITQKEKTYLHHFLTERFSLGNLKALAFDLGIDYELFDATDKSSLARDLIRYFDRSDNIACLIKEAVNRRPDKRLAAIQIELPPCGTPISKVQVVVSSDQIRARDQARGKLISQLAEVLGVEPDEITLIATSHG